MKNRLIIRQLRFSCTIPFLLAFVENTYTGRHTFATTVTLANNVSIENVSKMLGHKNIKMTQHYAKILEKTVVREMGELAGKLKYIAC